MILSRHLLFTQEEFDNNSALNGTAASGSYNTMEFVLRLRDDVRKALNDDEMDFVKIQASSTSLHENIHWWQHVGSNFGFLFSLAYPAFAHKTFDNLKNIISLGLTYKPITKYDKDYYDKNGKSDIADINIILNNYHDLEYAKIFALDNKNITEIIKDRKFFINVGHCYFIFWTSTINSIAGSIDRERRFLPNIDNWPPYFKLLTERNIDGFVTDSSMHISPLGIKAIYEGQAVFNQIQYLTRYSPDLTYADFENIGLLHGIYIEAFEIFLSITGYKKPSNVLDPIVGLFLIICDISINPNNGFPLDIYDYENFIKKNDPGIRFYFLCISIQKNTAEYLKKINLYSKEEYIILSKELSESIGCKCSYESILEVLKWQNEKYVAQILNEEIDLKFINENLPIRLMFSKYFRFQEDKYNYPNVFCWIGFHSISTNSNVEFEIVDSLFKKHHALFTDDYDGEIKPVLFEGRKDENIIESFNNFYNFNLLYDLILQWVDKEGEFKFNYKWIVNEREKEFIPIVKENFKMQFGISLDDIKIL